MNASSFATGTVEYTGAPEAFADWLRARAEYLEAWEGDTPTVHTLRRVAQELDAAFRRGATRPVSLAEAAEIGGYSVSHLGRLLRDQPERNIGTKHRPAFACYDVPRKAGYQPAQSDDEHTVLRLQLEPATQTGTSRPDVERKRPRAAGALVSRLLAAKAGGMRR